MPAATATVNPFKEGTIAHVITRELRNRRALKRSTIVERLMAEVPAAAAQGEAKMDYRVLRIAQLLTNKHGWTFERSEEKGPEQKLRGLPPRS